MTGEKVIFEKIEDNAKIPEKQHDTDVGYDIFSVEKVELAPEEIKLVRTGLKMKLPSALEAQIRPRSGYALSGVSVLNTPGTIDPGYRGEVKVILANLVGDKKVIEEGDRIAQMVFKKVERPDLSLGNLDDTERGKGGFGSTGK